MTAAELIGANDPPPFEIVNDGGEAALLLICDHASCAVPEALGNLGLDSATVTDHIGWDIGAAAVTRQLALLLDAPAVLAGYSTSTGLGFPASFQDSRRRARRFKTVCASADSAGYSSTGSMSADSSS